MKTGIFMAIVLHVAFLLFGGLIFNAHPEPKPKVVEVSLEDAQDVNKDKQNDEPKPDSEEARIEPSKDAPPDASEIIRNTENPSTGPPALAALDLSQLSAALNSSGGAEGFGQREAALGSGGVIGGKGKVGALESKDETTFSVSEIDQKPRAVHQTNPTFPAEMRNKNIDGVVVVIFIVTPDGRVSSPKSESSNHIAFEKPALEAIKQWKFEPGLQAGKRVATRMKVTIRFQRS